MIPDGPDNVTIEYHELFHANGTRRMVVLCHVTGLSPMTSDTITWGGLCQGQNGSTCMVSARTPQDDGKVVSCKASNSANNGYSLSARVKVDLNGKPQDSRSRTNALHSCTLTPEQPL